MIVFKKLKFSNVFSYGKNNEIDLSKDPVTQLIGNNGNGKSSIALILQEVTYNKNSKGIKKSDILNRNVEDKEYNINLTFTKDDDEYEINKVVKSTAKVSLYKNGEDISGHTATQTYKILENDIFQLDFNTFSKLIYQSVISSLDFLSATDANRKKFLISLLGLEKYAEAETSVKEAAKEAKALVTKYKTNTDTITTWISRNDSNMVRQPIMEVPEYDETLDVKIAELSGKVLRAEQENTQATIALQKKKKYYEVLAARVPEAESFKDQIDSNNSSISDTSSEIRSFKSKLAELNNIQINCPTCGQELGKDVSAIEANKKELKEKLAIFQDSLSSQEEQLSLNKKEHKKYETYIRWKRSLELAEASYDPSTNTDITIVSDLKKEIEVLKEESRKQKLEAKKAIAANSEAEKHNAKIDQIIDTLKSYKAELLEVKEKLNSSEDVHADYKILADTLSTKGVVQYKIESTIKVFEGLINEYLEELSEGEFVLSFNIEDTKLMLNLYKDSQKVDIKSISSGEFAKVNTATLLAVRSMMSSISKVNINLLILDEVISVLDEDSMPVLIQILLKEKNLNSFLVSHGYHHPLAETLQITKRKKLSCIN